MKASTEVTRTAIAAWLEREEAELGAQLTQPLALWCASHTPTAEALREHTHALLQRTIEHLHGDENPSPSSPAVEVLIGALAPRYPTARHVYVSWTEDQILVSDAAQRIPSQADLHPIVITIVACYIAAAAVNALLNYPFSPAKRTVRISVRDLLGMDPTWARDKIALGEAVLAGAGAVGNGFLTGLRCFAVQGRLYIADPKVVKDSILPRCLWFDLSDIEEPKAEVLVRKAAPTFRDLTLIPWKGTVSELRVTLPGSKIERLIVGVDSRRARRRLQSELPREVYDASTTGIAEVVLHFNTSQDTNACMACIYKEELGELQHETHVAEALGISVDAVRREFVTHSDAVAIVKHHPDLEVGALIGRAFDSLFRERCATGKLPSDADRQVLPPLPFVSVLAGAWLALETMRRIAGEAPAERFNYWRLSPWHSPNPVLRQMRPKDPVCECCSNEAVREAIGILWG
ncbi:MAG TPA: ThiF family adenylyltransferase [Steroidobacteraceae bacterium]|nr:ThiF family adenylyltransferase [Steroidobacteraceae bacterium]